MLAPHSDRYSESEVLAGIARVLQEQFGEACAMVSPDETIDLCFKRLDGPHSIWAKLGHGTWEELDFADLLIEINEAFGLDLLLDHWIAQLNGRGGSRKTLDRVPTWRQIAEVVVANAVCITAIPKRILGRNCLPAGVFETLSLIAQRVSRADGMRIGPSDLVHERLTWRTRKFRTRVEANFSLSLPPAPRSYEIAATSILAICLAGWLACLAGIFTGHVILIGVGFGLFVTSIGGLLLVHTYWPPFPAELRTFKALSRWIATEIQKQPTRLSA